MLEILRKFFRFCDERERSEFYRSIVLGVLAALFSALKIPAIGVMLQAILVEGVTAKTILLSLAVMLISVIGSSILKYRATALQTDGGYSTTANKRVQIAEHLRYLPMGYFNENSLGAITSVTTNDDGEAHVSGIKKEAYIEVVETAAPAGYVLDKTPHGIHIDPYDPTTEDDPVLTVTNRARPALRILKYDLTSNSPMPDVTFEVWHDGDLFGEYTTNASGEIFLYELDPGTYLVKEIATDDAHVVNSTN